eukprot:m51a1_g13328 hypothetical protein (160) ;mRNA; f:769-1926
MLNAVRSIKDKIKKEVKQASKETSSASADEAKSSSSKSIDELQGKKVVESPRSSTAAGPDHQGLGGCRAKLKEKIATYKKEQVRVSNELHEQHVLIAMLKSQNEGLKEQLELLKSERDNWMEYESLKGTSTTPSKHKVPTSHPAHPASGSADGADTPTC